MKSKGLLLLLLITLAYNGVFAKNRSSRPRLRRNDFPEDFIFGSATSAYQCEGAAHEDGRGPSIWDTYSEEFPEKIMDGSNGSVADDSYYLYKEDVNLLHQIGFNAYRFSISWSRILPRGNLKGGINQAGINYYNNLINQLLLKGVKPYVTIFHWDLPEALEVAYGGFLGAEIVNDFRDYAELCFQKFGDRVKHWMTLNEPFTVVKQGYLTGEKAPGRCSSFTNPNCLGGDGATEPYIVGHNFLLAHGAAVKVYREKYQVIHIYIYILFYLICLSYVTEPVMGRPGTFIRDPDSIRDPIRIRSENPDIRRGRIRIRIVKCWIRQSRIRIRIS
ncbi:hypothetical protein DY000_02056692 [Brassica cretica]|uniref:thioglucosidase n=1 Tax=Brassica cretica TaxID=69181 RepID=A0ABQ7AKW7_BRACR|nr:hypothetical protein DY000_02056692 [Brassica cretica]